MTRSRRHRARSAARPSSSGALDRRGVLRGGLGALGLMAARPVPTVFAKQTFHLRVLGTHVTLQEAIRRQAEQDLGIELEFHPGGSAAVLHQASTRPASFDLYEQWSDSINVLWQAQAIQPLELSRLTHWDDVSPLAKTGRLTAQARYGAGDSPERILFVQRNGTLAGSPTQQISYLPYVHNADSFGYDTRVVARGVAYETESWAWLLDDRYRGKVALVNQPTIGLFDAALAADAAGLLKFRNIGDLSETELDALFRLLIELKKQGHFRGVWRSVPDSVEMMRRGEVAVESMFSPAAAALNGQGVPCVYAAPKEGYRAWQGVMCLSSRTDGRARDAAYAYMNWWLSGWPGAFIARQGYYISTSQLSRPYLSEEEWDYWYEGKNAAQDLKNTAGEVAVLAGSKRNGGSYLQRFSNIAVWNTVMPTYEYSLQRWAEFLAA